MVPAGRLLLLLLLVGRVRPAAAQHDHSGHTMPDSTHSDSSKQAMGLTTMPASEVQQAPTPEMVMSGMLLPGLPMQRDASGTSWQPDATPMYAVHATSGAWNLMFHGGAFLRYTAQDVFESGTRGDSRFDAPNWIMMMAQRPLGTKSQIGLRSMLSLDPVTEGGAGYPLLFQTGETHEGEPLIDRQHPHDLFSELSISYGQQLGGNAGVFGYLGFPGEPTLGPPAFMHRASGQRNPDSPIGHHWQDATHILFGVATLGFRYGAFKLDGSVFTGREPDEERFGFDRPRFDSYSLRLAANPTENLALQVSRGFLRSPEALAPDVDEWRTTASALYNTPFGSTGNWATTLVWGLNETANTTADDGHAHGPLHALLLESDLDFSRYAFYTRLEWTQKTGSSLGVDLSHEAEHATYNIGAFTLGAATDLVQWGNLQVEVGAQGSLYAVPEDLRSIYGERPVSAQVYLRLSPTQMMHTAVGPAGAEHAH
jgi:hypothetical protein